LCTRRLQFPVRNMAIHLRRVANRKPANNENISSGPIFLRKQYGIVFVVRSLIYFARL
jgi:hypothetical protein